MSWWRYNRNWMLVVGVIIVLLIIAGAFTRYLYAPRRLLGKILPAR